MTRLDRLDGSAARKKLGEELRWIAEKGIPAVFLDPSEATGRFAITGEIVRTLEPEKWAEHPPGALSAVMRRAIRRLPAEGEPASLCQMSYQRMAQILYRFVTLEPKADGTLFEYKDYVTKAKEESRFVGGNFSRPTKEVRGKLAAVLLDLYAKSRITPQTQPATPSSPEPTQVFIDRRRYVERITTQIAAGDRVVSIYGEPGTGKSTLAQVVASELAGGKPVVTVHVAEKNAFEVDIISALKVAGLSPETWSPAACQDALRDQLSEDSDLGAVIFDDVTDAADARTWKLVPARPAVPIILTSRTRREPPTGPTGPHQHRAAVMTIEVGEFTEEEADLFVGRALPACSEMDRRLLIAALGRRPLVLFHATRFLAETDLVGPVELVSSLAEGVTMTLEVIEPSLTHTPKLPRLYQIILDEVVTEMAAAEVLDAFLAATGTAGKCEQGLLSFAMRAVFPSPHVTLRIATGAGHLGRYGLLRREGDWWAMHPLTWKVLRELRSHAQRPAATAYLAAITDSQTTAHDAATLGAAKSLARLLYEEIRAGADLHPGWAWLLAVDEATWIACRDWPNDTGATRATYRRYDVLPAGVLSYDYTTGARAWVHGVEAAQLVRVVQLYGIVCEAEKYVNGIRLDPDSPDYGLQRARTWLTSNDTEMLTQIVTMSTDQPIFHKNQPGSQALADDAAARLAELASLSGKSATVSDDNGAVALND